ncbi:Short-chain dehydrogenase/reductase family protein [Penicillium malachiteum]|uniref:Short-chain dehydrogenase/reductase family protein n=1 Tax=Penicillium malachiteum TaxID=1324776 RepID=UPI002548413A|nr:Short-chain dehydrogenase/reductase family protein [Penicillium malachiteum]KAJ5731699.1 Short-chain dehydrogenase/reductase family protein [Penicillium malachiteum]
MPSFLYSQFLTRPPYPKGSLDGQTILITGANVGLGKESARHVVRLGAARVILGVRNVKAGEEAKKDIESSTNRPGVCEVWEVDLASYKSVLAFGERISTLPRLDSAILNAAIATHNFELAEGYERTITVNVISTLLLGLLLLPKLKETKVKFPSSIPHLTFVVSEVHGWVEFNQWKEDKTLQTLSDKDRADMSARYPTSKLLEVLVVHELASRVRGSEVVINMINPGLCHSSLAREGNWKFTLFKLVVARSTEVGSRTLVAGILNGTEAHGSYMNDGYVDGEGMSPFVRSADGAKARAKVWYEVTSILEGVRPGILQNI